MSIALTPSQVRVLKALSKLPADGFASRKQISQKAFGGNSINFVPILTPLCDAKMVKMTVVGGDDTGVTKEEVFAITAAGRRTAEKAPIHNGRGAGQHQSLPKAGGVITKTYKDKEFKVKVLSDGFQVGSSKYTSLTAAAKAIRGSDQEVNGWAFFGLTKKEPKADAKPKAPKAAKPAKTKTVVPAAVATAN